MRKIIKTLIIVILFLAASIPATAKASTTDINELIENAKEMDGSKITIQGEAIGERMNRGEYSWININDGTNAIGIWMKNIDADQVTYFGNYKYIGDTIQITGTFYRACKEHGGEADFHADTIQMIKNGHEVKEQVPAGKIIISISMMIVAALLLLFYVKKIKN
jgi:hypothetical protein